MNDVKMAMTAFSGGSAAANVATEVPASEAILEVHSASVLPML